MKNSYSEIELQVARTLDYLASVVNAQSDEDFGNLYLQILTALEAQMQTQNTFSAPTDQITANQAILHVKDQTTGHVYCRTLPLDYHENNNGVTLAGENLDEEETQISFLSNTALEKIKDLVGLGPDASPCHGHDE